jgi:PAS domain S-box-containing protein
VLCLNIEYALTTHKFVAKIIEAIDAGVFIVDKNGLIVAVNSNFEKITTLSREELVGKNVQYMLDKGYINDAACLRVMRELQPVTCILNYMGKVEKDVIVTGKPVFDKDGKLSLVVSTLRDWNKLAELYQELNSIKLKSERYKQQLENLNLQQMEDSDFIAKDRRSRNMMQMAARIAKVDSTALILGESGVGKDVLARFMHKHSARAKEGTFVHVNCGAIPETLFESELFGYVAGAFTGAKKAGKPGLIEVADKGTLFLDEIAELPLLMQAKLLKVLQEKTVMRLGDTKEIPIDVKIIAATNKDIDGLVAAGKFRQDLYYRLNMFKITLASLRDRKDDIPPLIAFFVRRCNEKYHLNKSISNDVYEALINYNWPGNVRELEHTIEQMLVLCPDDVIRLEHLPEPFSENLLTTEAVRISGTLPLKNALENIEKAIILNAIHSTDTLSDAAEQLGIDLSTLTRKKQKHGIFRKKVQ